MGDISREVVPSVDEGAVGEGRKVEDRSEMLDGRSAPPASAGDGGEATRDSPRLGALARGAAMGEAARVTPHHPQGDPPRAKPGDDPWEVVDDDDPAPTEQVPAEQVPADQVPVDQAPPHGEVDESPPGDPEFEEVPPEAIQPPGDPEGGTAEAEPAAPDAEEAPQRKGAAPLPDVPAIEGIDHLSRVLLTLLLAAREGTSLLRLAQSCDVSQKAVVEGLDHLTRFLGDQQLPLELARSGEQVRLVSMPEVFPYLQRLRGVKKTERLSQAALETLAVIAYRQPVIRAEIEAIRGVKAGPILRTLLDHKLVKVTGRADVPGRPLQYGTTQEFLERFALTSLKDLPSVKEFKQLG